MMNDESYGRMFRHRTRAGLLFFVTFLLCCGISQSPSEPHPKRDENGSPLPPRVAFVLPDRGITVGLFGFIGTNGGEVTLLGVQTPEHFYYLESKVERESMLERSKADDRDSPGLYGLTGPLTCGRFDVYVVCLASIPGLRLQSLLVSIEISASGVLLRDVAFVAEDISDDACSNGLRLILNGDTDPYSACRTIEDNDRDGRGEIVLKDELPVVIIEQGKLRVDLRRDTYMQRCRRRYSVDELWNAVFCQYLAGTINPETLLSSPQGDWRAVGAWIKDLEHWAHDSQPKAAKAGYELKTFGGEGGRQ